MAVAAKDPQGSSALPDIHYILGNQITEKITLQNASSSINYYNF